MTDSVNEERDMFNTLDNLAARITRPNCGCAVLDSACELTARRKSTNEHGPTFSKIFRWQPSDSQAPTPASVELAGSFTDWRVVALTRDAVTNTWQVGSSEDYGRVLHKAPGGCALIAIFNNALLVRMYRSTFAENG